MKPARTKSSVNLRAGPGTKFAPVDSLEAGYPLIVHDLKDGWMRVTAKAHGVRTKDQAGYIDARFVEMGATVIVADDAPEIPDLHDCLLRLPEWLWVLGSVAVVLLILAAIILI